MLRIKAIAKSRGCTDLCIPCFLLLFHKILFFGEDDVDLVGVEPTSAQGNPTLSTRLFQPLVFVCRQDLDHQPTSYPLNFHQCSEAYTDYSRFNLHRLLSGFGTRSSERCLVQLSNSWIKPVIYCTSIRQRERNYFRQLIFR